MTEPVTFQPEPGTCHDQYFNRTGSLNTYRPVPCEDGFRLETVYVGTFNEDAADRTSPPRDGSPEMVEAYQECDAEAAEYLGADFRHGRLWLGVVRPSPHAWRGGARWFRCDVGVWRVHESKDVLIRHDSSLRDALAGDSDLALGCYEPDFYDDDHDEWIRKMNPVDCGEPHSAEFVGVWTGSDTTFMDFEVEDDVIRIHRGCRSVVAEYVGVPDDADLRFRTSTIAWTISEADWQDGNRGFQCYLWLWNRQVSESLARAGTRGLPIQTG